MKIEICANSFASALAAQNAGADRIELCSQLSVGGLTPSYGLITKVKEELTIPIHVLIRPRAGDFKYTKYELDIMIRDIKFCKDLGCAGVVSGVLKKDTSLDASATKQLMQAAGNLEFTFHRAFDLVPNASETLRVLEQLGVTRILSSGQKSKAIDGIETLKILLKISEGIQLMPGSGINTDNALNFKEAGFEMIHFSAISKADAPHKPKGVSFNEGVEGTSDENVIRQIVALVH
ncbi:MAG: copper homeostasis protein [Planctomycetota bacterium]|jgi:copper homeostasis protein